MRSEEDINWAIGKYADMVKRICVLHLKNHADTEDIFQTVFLKYALHTSAFQSEEHEKAWLIRVTLNACRDLLRSFFRSRTVPLEEIARQAAAADEESRDVLRAVLQGLAVLGGIYALLLLELLLGMLRRRRAATVGTAGTGRAPGAPPSPAVPIASALLLPAPSPWRDPRGGRGGPGPTARR